MSYRFFLARLALSLAIFSTTPVFADSPEQYRAYPGLIDLRSNISDGEHTIAELAGMARERGFKILFFNDHDRVEIAYGLPPFRNLLRYKQSRKSIMTRGPEKYLAEIQEAGRQFPDMILIPGCITSPYYYWTGSWFKGDLTVHEYDRKLLILNLEKPEDYSGLPNIGNRLSFKYTRVLWPGLIIYVIPLAIGSLLLAAKGRRHFWWSLFLIAGSIFAMLDYNPLRSSRFSPYQPEPGLEPYQEVIDYVHQRGGLSFWNYPEQRSGVREEKSIRLSTPPYPELIHKTQNQTGFSALYGDAIFAIDPGREWDRALNDYCRGQRKTPPWGIATADFHADGRLNLKLGAFPTTFFLKEFSKKDVLAALRQGRMYGSFTDGKSRPQIETFYLAGDPEQKAVMGETLVTNQQPRIYFTITDPIDPQTPATLFLIRGGKRIKTFAGPQPLVIEYLDKEIPPQTLTYYRLMDSRKRLVSNPIFVKYAAPASDIEDANKTE
ncbi:MAG: hypothetical protein EHM45_02565 [Desulfobacteraceae bacterium]|nr:MAG: hypothetical protein EHM45_02565 [Desulfobacteraceae bacterium]